MKTTHIYIKSLVLQNFRTFGEEKILRFEKQDGTIPQWTLILGDNGIGKSTLLQGVAWMQPRMEYLDEEFMDEGDIDATEPAEPRITNEENETLIRMVRRADTNTTEESASIKALFVANKKLNQKNHRMMNVLVKPKQSLN